jgi:hypothetical protein
MATGALVPWSTVGALPRVHRMSVPNASITSRRQPTCCCPNHHADASPHAPMACAVSRSDLRWCLDGLALGGLGLAALLGARRTKTHRLQHCSNARMRWTMWSTNVRWACCAARPRLRRGNRIALQTWFERPVPGKKRLASLLLPAALARHAVAGRPGGGVGSGRLETTGMPRWPPKWHGSAFHAVSANLAPASTNFPATNTTRKMLTPLKSDPKVLVRLHPYCSPCG